ncbi:MAG: tRNA pseudouridine(55) synthase TruB [Clostridia bacterium]|nr:tRNA pseudouridine(55) synthase TruB [Clostridia bacterium]
MQGLILVNKPSGITSFKAVSKIKYLCATKRVGHTGTLDPMATGVLPVFIGRATVLSNFLLESDKRYIAEITLGISTDTADITGNVINRQEVNVTKEQIEAVLKTFVGKQMQLPPMYSAIKKDGVRLYTLARQGVEVEREAREIEIHSIDLVSDFKDNKFSIDVSCSKGTYIRSLCTDIGEKLGVCATLSSLQRTKTAQFCIENCVDLDVLTKENVSQYIISEEAALMHFKEVNITSKQATRFSNGGQLDLDRLKIENISDHELLRVRYNDTFLGLGSVNLEKNQLDIKCLVNIL